MTPRVRGFSLLELMVTMTVAAVMLAVAAPSFRTTVLHNSRTAATNEILAATSVARSEAQKLGKDGLVCGRAAGSNTCLGTGDDWRQGVVAFIDVNNDKDFDAGDTELYYTGPLSESLYIKSSRSPLVFRPFSKVGQGGTIKICDVNNAMHGRSVVVSLSGRAHSSKVSCP